MRIWLFNPPADKTRLKELKRQGINQVVCTNQALNWCASLEMDTYTMIHTFRRTEYPEDLAVDINQEPIEWFNSGCPNSPRIRQQFYAQLENLLSKPVRGVFLDGVRFSSPASCPSPTSFFTCFCSRCREDMVRRGFDLDLILQDVARAANIFLQDRAEARKWLFALRSPSGWMAFLQQFPGFEAWLHYRVLCIRDFVQEVRQWLETNHPDKELGGFLFQPALSFLVGQDYRMLSEFLDILSPMIYRNYPHSPGPAAINQEILAMANFLGQKTLSYPEKTRLINDLLYIFGLPGELSAKELPSLSISSHHVVIETLAAQRLSANKAKVVPIIWAGDTKLAEVLEELAQQNVEDCILFTYDTGLIAHGDNFLDICG